jgi:hypothetical protein
VPVLAQPFDDSKRVCVDGSAVDPMLGLGVHNGLSHRLAVRGSTITNEQYKASPSG